MPTAFVTGVTGFLGRNLLDELHAQGWHVVGLCRRPEDRAMLRQLGCAAALGDVRDAQTLLDAMPARVEAVFHLAGDISQWRPQRREQMLTNVVGTRNAVAAALARRARRFVLTSSFSAWGMVPDRITESTPQQGERSPVHYGRSKWLAEDEVRRSIASGLDAVILNPAYTIGPYDTRGWSRVIRMIETGRLSLVPPGAGTFCHSREVARAHVAAATAGRTGEHYLLGGADATYLELAQTIARMVGRRPPRAAAPAGVFRALGRAAEWWSYVTRREPDITSEAALLVTSRLTCSSDKAIRELGFRAVPLATMLADCHRWMASRDP